MEKIKKDEFDKYKKAVNLTYKLKITNPEILNQLLEKTDKDQKSVIQLGRIINKFDYENIEKFLTLDEKLQETIAKNKDILNKLDKDTISTLLEEIQNQEFTCNASILDTVLAGINNFACLSSANNDTISLSKAVLQNLLKINNETNLKNILSIIKNFDDLTGVNSYFMKTLQSNEYFLDKIGAILKQPKKNITFKIISNFFKSTESPKTENISLILETLNNMDQDCLLLTLIEKDINELCQIDINYLTDILLLPKNKSIDQTKLNSLIGAANQKVNETDWAKI